MKNNKLRVLFCLLFALSTKLSAQHKKDHQQRHEKVKAYQISFLTKELELEVAEAEKFWPLFREYDQLKDAMRKAYYQRYKRMDDSLDFLTEKKAAELLGDQQQLEMNMLHQKNAKLSEIENIIGAKKTLQLLHLEHRFRKELLNKMRKKNPEKKKN